MTEHKLFHIRVDDMIARILGRFHDLRIPMRKVEIGYNFRADTIRVMVYSVKRFHWFEYDVDTYKHETFLDEYEDAYLYLLFT